MNIHAQSASGALTDCTGFSKLFHFKYEFAAAHDVGMADLPVGDRPAVQLDGLHVLVLTREVPGDHREIVGVGVLSWRVEFTSPFSNSSLQLNRHPRHLRRAENVFAAARING